MQRASFLCPYDSVFKVLQTIALEKGFVMEFADEKRGIIKAHRRNYFFRKAKTLDISIEQVDRHTTNMKLMLNNNVNNAAKPSTLDEFEELRLLDSIYNHF